MYQQQGCCGIPVSRLADAMERFQHHVDRLYPAGTCLSCVLTPLCWYVQSAHLCHSRQCIHRICSCIITREWFSEHVSNMWHQPCTVWSFGANSLHWHELALWAAHHMGHVTQGKCAWIGLRYASVIPCCMLGHNLQPWVEQSPRIGLHRG